MVRGSRQDDRAQGARVYRRDRASVTVSHRTEAGLVGPEEVVAREVEAHALGGSDALRADTVAQLDVLIPAFEAAEKAVASALAVAGTQLDAAEEDLDRLLEKVYGTLIADLGKASAEAFFPRQRAGSRRRTGGGGDAGADAGAPA